MGSEFYYKQESGKKSRILLKNSDIYAKWNWDFLYGHFYDKMAYSRFDEISRKKGYVRFD